MIFKHGRFYIFLAAFLLVRVTPFLHASDLSRDAAVFFAAGNLTAAEAALQKALDRGNDPLKVYLELGALREEAGDFEGASQWYGRAAALAGDPICRAESAGCLARTPGGESLSKSISILDGVLADFPELAEPQWTVALAHRQLARRMKAGSKAAQAEWSEARQHLEKYTIQHPESGAAFYVLGECGEALDDKRAAVAAYTKAIEMEPNFKVLHKRLARLLLALGERKAALARYERATAVEPSDKALRAEKDKLLKKDKKTARERSKARQLKWLLAEPPEAKPLPASPATIRVGLETGLSRLVFRGRGDLVLTTPALTEIRVLEGSCDFTVAWTPERRAKGRKGGVIPATGAILDSQGNTLTTFDQRIWITPKNPDSTLALHALATGSGYFFAKEEDRFYRGTLEIHPGPGPGFNVINRVPLEWYVAGVLPSEMPPSWDLEALKAQAVAARTESLAKQGRHNKSGFDVCDEVHCQAYVGLKAELPKTNQAVEETAGLVLWNNDAPFNAFYSAQCGGHTQDAREAWGYGLPVLGVPDFDTDKNHVEFPLLPRETKEWILLNPEAYCSLSGVRGYRNFRWTFLVSAVELEAKEKLKEIGRLKTVRVVERSKAGWALKVVFTGDNGEKSFTGDSVRGILGGLRSGLLWLEGWPAKDGHLEDLVVYGGGWGHGVGMCQAGALGLARKGADYKAILKHYYPKASFKKL